MQVLLNAMNSNTATIGEGFAEGVIASYNQTLAGGRNSRAVSGDWGAEREPPRHGIHTSRVSLQSGLEPTWFIVTGILGVLLI